MPLVDLESVASLLVCPRCSSSLTGAEGTLRCTNAACACSAAGPFPTVGRHPVLVDFERSILRRQELPADGADVPPLRPRSVLERLPPPIRAWWRPRNGVAASNVARLLSLLEGPSPLVLVVGGGTIGNGVDDLYRSHGVRLVAFDVYSSPHTQLIADAHRIPLADATVDAVLIQAVLEHVLEPSRVVAEIRRVLRPAGLVYAETPFLQQVHAGPYDFTRFTSSGHRYLFRGFDELAAGSVAGAGTQMLWSVDHLVRGLTRSAVAGKAARAGLFWLRYLDRLVAPEFGIDSSSAFFFLGRRAERELAPSQIVPYYRGAQRPRRDDVTRARGSSDSR